MNNPFIANARMPGEGFAEYRLRLRMLARKLRDYLRYGVPAAHARSGEEYVPGKRKQGPHKVEKEGMRLSPKGVPEKHTFSVMHPGTLRKLKEKSV